MSNKSASTASKGKMMYYRTENRPSSERFDHVKYDINGYHIVGFIKTTKYGWAIKR